MSLKQLDAMEQEARSSEYHEANCKGGSDDLSNIRRGPHSLSRVLEKVFPTWNYGGQKAARDELYAVLDEMAADIFRIAEMRLAAKARYHRVEAAQKRAIIAAAILPLPELEGENNVF